MARDVFTGTWLPDVVCDEVVIRRRMEKDHRKNASLCNKFVSPSGAEVSCSGTHLQEAHTGHSRLRNISDNDAPGLQPPRADIP